MADDLIHTDVLVWSEQQANLLRRVATGEDVGALVDWENVIEEVESVGRCAMLECQGLLRRALANLLKVRASVPPAPPVDLREDTFRCLSDAQRAYAPSMRERIDLDDLYASAVHQVSYYQESKELEPPPEKCPFELPDLMNDKHTFVDLLGKLNR